MNFKKTKLAAAVGAGAMALALSAPANAVVLGGDNGWEVSLTGTINLFASFMDFATDDDGGASTDGSEDSFHLQEGLLPAFFTFKAKSPTINGLTGTAQVSFAPDSSSAKNTRNDKGGSAIDMREVFFKVDGSFGAVTVGRTLGLYQRQAILKDMTLFGVGAQTTPDNGGTTLGRIGYGYIYPEFRTRIGYTTPNINGFVLDLAMFDPQEPIGTTAHQNWETDMPQFQGELTYNTTWEGASLGFWVGGIWQTMDCQEWGGGGSFGGSSGCSGDNDAAHGDSIDSWGWNVGADIAFSGFNFVGNFYSGEALGMGFFAAAPGSGRNNSDIAGGILAGGYDCSSDTGCDEADNDGFYLQGTYTWNKTKFGISYGESNQDGQVGSGTDLNFRELSNEMWTVGVYHDVNSWLKVVAEYSDQQSTTESSDGSFTTDSLDVQTFSVGGFIFW
jgi:predicted porin